MAIMGVGCWKKMRGTLVGNEKLMELRSLEVDIMVVCDREKKKQNYQSGGKSPMNEKE